RAATRPLSAPEPEAAPPARAPAERVLPHAILLRDREGRLRDPEPRRRRRRPHPLVERLPARDLRLAGLRRGDRPRLRGCPRGRATPHPVRQRGAALRPRRGGLGAPPIPAHPLLPPAA